MDSAFAQRGDDIEEADYLEERRVEMVQLAANNYSRILAVLGMEEEGDPVAKIEQLHRACEGLPPFALDGGWNAAGMSAHARKLEDALNEILILPTDQIGDAYVIAGEALALRHNVELRGAEQASLAERPSRTKG